MKKGSVGMVASLVIAIVVFTILLAPWKDIFQLFLADTDDKACQASVIANAGFNVAGRTFFSLQCKREQLDFNEKDIQDQTAHMEIGKRLYKCWNNMGKGLAKQFNSNFLLIGDNPCLICAEIRFHDTLTSQIEGIGSHLRSQKIKTSELGVWEHVYGNDFPINEPTVTKVGNDWRTSNIYTEKTYYMVYRARNNAVVNIDLLNKEENPVIMLVSGDDLREMKCDYFYN